MCVRGLFDAEEMGALGAAVSGAADRERLSAYRHRVAVLCPGMDPRKRVQLPGESSYLSGFICTECRFGSQDAWYHTWSSPGLSLDLDHFTAD